MLRIGWRQCAHPTRWEGSARRHRHATANSRDGRANHGHRQESSGPRESSRFPGAHGPTVAARCDRYAPAAPFLLEPATWSPGAPWLTPNPGYRAPGTPVAGTSPNRTSQSGGGCGVRRRRARDDTPPAPVGTWPCAPNALRPSTPRSRPANACVRPVRRILASLLGQLAQIPTREFDMRRVVD